MRTVWSHIRAASRSSCVMHLNHSNINSLASLSPEQRGKFLDGLTTAERALLAYTWPAWARLSQLPPAGNWRVERAWKADPGRARWRRKPYLGLSQMDAAPPRGVVFYR